MSQSIVTSLGGWIYVGLRVLGIIGFAIFVIFSPINTPATYDSSPSSIGVPQSIPGNYGASYVVLNSSKPVHSGERLQGNVTLPNYKVSSLQIPDCTQPLQPYTSAPVPSLFVMTSDQHSQWVASSTQTTDPKAYVELQRCFGYDTQTQTLWLKFNFSAQTDTYYWFAVSVPSGYTPNPAGTYAVAGYVSPQTPRLNASIVTPPKTNWQNVAGWLMGIAAVAGASLDAYQRVSRRNYG